MIPEKAYILRISNELSQEYSEQTAKSCEKIGLPYEFFDGVEKKSGYDAWIESGVSYKPIGLYKTHKIDASMCATVSHALIWKKILENRETAIILEHDAIMLHPMKMEIPNNMIVTLGYKLQEPTKYDHKKAGPPNEVIEISGHEGAHAYAITWKTAELLLSDLNEIGVSVPIDNMFFLKMRKTKVPLTIASPTPAIAWIRKSTIWPESSSLNYDFISSFNDNLIK